MLKGNHKIPDRPRKVFPDMLGSLVLGFELKESENAGGSLASLESGEELKAFEPNGLGSVQPVAMSDFVDEKPKGTNLDIRSRLLRPAKDGHGQVSAMEGIIAADEKRSDLQYELSQPEINLEKLQRIANNGLPDGGGLRATAWKLLLGYLPPSHEMWEKDLTEHRSKYAKLKEELLSSPARWGENTTYAETIVESNINDGPLQRQKISPEDHPLSVGKSSAWSQFFQYTEIVEQIDRDLQRTHPDLKFFSGDTQSSRKHRESMKNVLLLFAKLNPAIRYVQGMNEVLAPIYYIFSTDPDEQNAANAEADSFSCFVRLLSDSVDHFCQQLDNSSVGILSTLSRLSDLLKENDEELWRHLEHTTKVKSQFYAFRWITLLLTQEFSFQSIMRIWDSLLSNPFGIQDMLLRVCCAMLLCLKGRLLCGDFIANLKLLQHYPTDINIDHLLNVATQLSPDTSSYSLSL
ncbi:hypothetical protein SAY86_025923 [Trapa natans]|uniref:Rab-GAP TBC domain-containing protein n=1 Tax=Trapa natans TaxID=22666 RepID=A0AAN7K9Z2_TRANT|nr:hypothetical protein SAY86_025923 [Trapa natans]